VSATSSARAPMAPPACILCSQPLPAPSLHSPSPGISGATLAMSILEPSEWQLFSSDMYTHTYAHTLEQIPDKDNAVTHTHIVWLWL